MGDKAIVFLEDGTYYLGKSAGAKGTTHGEVCFNTGMTGYQEIFTDPSYHGQIMVTTNAHIGNYGARNAEDESGSVQISGLVCKHFSNKYSRRLADGDLQDYCEKHGLIAIHDVDTRAIVKHIRNKGAMNCIISTEEFDPDVLKTMVGNVPDMNGRELASVVSTSESYTLGNQNSETRVAVYDFGVKKNILRSLVDRGCYLKVFPAKTDISELLEFKPSGIFLSNGPGDPSSMQYAVDNVTKALEQRIPIFGICLGHQILALTMGVKTYKMHHGHRGINHPVINLKTGKSEITSQNHGFGVDHASVEGLADKVRITHRNLNDDTLEGIELVDYPAFSVQYHPEAAPGPHDSRYLFDDFINELKK